MERRSDVWSVRKTRMENSYLESSWNSQKRSELLFFGGDIAVSIGLGSIQHNLKKCFINFILTLLFNVFGWDCLPFLYFCLISLILQIMVMYPPQPAEPVSAGFNEETGEPVEITVSPMKSRL